MAAQILDSYSESNFDTTNANQTGSQNTDVGQAFKPAVNAVLTNAKFYLKKQGSPTGNAVAKVYNATGTYGTNAVPTGAAIAVSDNFDISTLTTSYALATFNFSGANRISLVANTAYVVVIEYTNGNASNYDSVGADGGLGSTTHPGNAVTSDNSGGLWVGYSTIDSIFYVLGSPIKTFTVDGVVKAINTQTFTVDGVVKVTGNTKTFTMDAIISDLIENFKDDFSEGFDTAGRWEPLSDSSNESVVNAQLQFRFPTSAFSVEEDANSKLTKFWDLRNSHAHLTMGSVPFGDLLGNYQMDFVLRTNDAANYIQFYNDGNNLNFLYNDLRNGDGNDHIISGVAYNAVNHKWLRFRHSGSTVFWDTSPDGITWTNQASHADFAWINELQIYVHSRNESGTQSVTTIDSVNTVVTAKTFTTDAIVKVTGNTKTFTVDGVVRVTTTKTFTVDGIVDVRSTKTFTVDGIVKVTTIADIGSALSFDGSHNYVQFPDSNDIDLTGNICVECEINWQTGTGGIQTFIKKDLQYILRLDATNKLNAYIWTSVTGLTNIHDTIAITPGIHHIALSWDGTTFRLLKDGSVIATATPTGTLNSGSNVLTVGAKTGNGENLNGIVDSVRISNIARYTGSYTAPTSQLTRDSNTVFLARFDEGHSNPSATQVTDEANGLVGSFNGSPAPAWVNSILPGQLEVDGIVSAVNTKTFTVDGIVKLRGTLSFLVGAYVGTQFGTVLGYALDGMFLKAPYAMDREYIYQKTDYMTITGKSVRDLSHVKEKFTLYFKNMQPADVAVIETACKEGKAVPFSATNGVDLNVNEQVWPYIASITYDMIGNSYLAKITLELIEVS